MKNKIYRTIISCYFTRAQNFHSRSDKGTWAEEVFEEGAEGDIWATAERGNAEEEKTA